MAGVAEESVEMDGEDVPAGDVRGGVPHRVGPGVGDRMQLIAGVAVE
jgi:hypothetical protein